MESMREAKENYRVSNSIINTTSIFGGKHRKISHNSRIGSKRSFDHGESSTRCSAGYSLNFQAERKTISTKEHIIRHTAGSPVRK